MGLSDGKLVWNRWVGLGLWTCFQPQLDGGIRLEPYVQICRYLSIQSVDFYV